MIGFLKKGEKKIVYAEKGIVIEKLTIKAPVKGLDIVKG